MALAAKTWTGKWWQLGGGGTVWDHMAYDPELDMLYIGVGNGSPWNRNIRSPQGGDNLFLSSIVAVRPDTGEYVWHYQVVPSESWDYTATQHMILADIEIDGKIRKVLIEQLESLVAFQNDQASPSELELLEAIAQSDSLAEALRAVGDGGNRSRLQSLQRRIRRFAPRKRRFARRCKPCHFRAEQGPAAGRLNTGRPWLGLARW